MTLVESDTSDDWEKLIGGPNDQVDVSTGKLVAVPSVKVPVVGLRVLRGEMSVHQITPSSVSLQDVVVTDFVLKELGEENTGRVAVVLRT